MANPVFEAEFLHQTRTQVYSRLSVLRISLIVAALFSLVLFFMVVFQDLIAVLLMMPVLRLRDFLEQIVMNTTVVVSILLFLTHVIVIAHALQMASSSVAREKVGRTWESLLLTGIDARRIVRGKWWATVMALWSVHRPLVIWRVIVIALMCSLILQSTLHDSPFFLLIFIAPVVLFVFTILAAGIAASCGVLASVLVAHESAAYRVAMAFHLLYVLVTLSIFFALVFSPSRMSPSLTLAILAPHDGGVMTTLQSATAGGNSLTFGLYLVGLGSVVASCAFLIESLLRIAEKVAIRQNAIPPT